ncbi:SDR family oxidoreductase [Blastomonas sp.]|uniref:SDR family oxidoreductase n=1 Tax=Blastomonas sp. TaxID=1909299 RepID=UPI003593AAD3
MTGRAHPPLALVTGGLRRVGAAIAADLAKAGWALALHGHSNCDPDDDLADVLAAEGSVWHGFLADLADPAQSSGLMHAVIARFGRAPDLLVNNASLFDYDDWHTITAASLHAHFAVNLVAPVLLSQALVAAAPAAGEAGPAQKPSIVNIIDQRVRNPNGDQLSYTLSKQALAEATRTLARAFGARARVNAVAPGLTLPTADYSLGQLQRLAERMPLGQLSAPDDIARAVRFLAESSAVTGQLLFVDGGVHMLSLNRDFVFLDTDAGTAPPAE